MNNIHIIKTLQWLKYAQDLTGDNGVSAWYSLFNGWQKSYIETTGYIINTFLLASKYLKDKEYFHRAELMADFLLEMQLENGAYRAHVPSKLNDNQKVVVFDIGQDLLGMTQIFVATKKNKYLKSAMAAANYLISIQENDGSWLKNTFGSAKHAYHTRVAWGILKVYQITKIKKYKIAAIKNLNWAVGQQIENGWFHNNNFPPPNSPDPYTHSIAYAIEGLFWSGKILKNSKYLLCAIKPSVAMLNYYIRHNYMPGTFDQKWRSKDSFSCLTGNAQIAYIWLQIYKLTKNKKFFFAAKKMNQYLKSQQMINTPFKSINGALAGSAPIWGDLYNKTGYCRLAYPNWAAKFFIDSLITEEQIKRGFTYEND